jgi:hypothetical protein
LGDDVAGVLGEGGPVRAELELQRDAGDDAQTKVTAKILPQNRAAVL